MRLCLTLVLLGFWLFNNVQAQPVQWQDDWQRTVMLPSPPKRIVSLAPHVTEILFAAGLGEKVIAVDLNSDFPAAAQDKKKISSFPVPDVEALIKLKPDLIVVWGAGFNAQLIEHWHKRGIATYVSDPKRTSQIFDTLKQFSTGSAQPEKTNAFLLQWARRAALLAAARKDRTPVKYFLQIWDQPLTTLSDQGIWAEASQWCAGTNVFAAQGQIAPTTDLESVRALRPALWLLAGGSAPSLANDSGSLVKISDSLIQRPGPRWLDAVEQLCLALDRAR
jgi:iron complex transport system substrate-binding protein